MREPVEDSLPFRWDLVTPEQLGSRVADAAPPHLWFLDDLVDCAGKVVARALVAYGRSAAGRRALVRAMASEPALAKRWLRTLVSRLKA